MNIYLSQLNYFTYVFNYIMACLTNNYYYAPKSCVLTQKLRFLFQDYTRMNPQITIPVNNFVWIIDSANYFNTPLSQIKALKPSNLYVIISSNTFKERESIKNRLASSGISCSIYEHSGTMNFENITREINQKVFTEMCIDACYNIKNIFILICLKATQWSRKNIILLIIICFFFSMITGLICLSINLFSNEASINQETNFNNVYSDTIFEELNHNVKILIESVNLQNTKIEKLTQIIKRT